MAYVNSHPIPASLVKTLAKRKVQALRQDFSNNQHSMHILMRKSLPQLWLDDLWLNTRAHYPFLLTLSATKRR